MPTRIAVVNRVVIAVAIQVQAVDGFGIEIGGIIGRNKSSPLGAVIAGIAVVQAGFFVVVVATIAQGIALRQGVVMRTRCFSSQLISQHNVLPRTYPMCQYNRWAFPCQ